MLPWKPFLICFQISLYIETAKVIVNSIAMNNGSTLLFVIHQATQQRPSYTDKAGFIRRIIVASNRIQFKSTEIVIKCDHYATWL